MKAVAILGRIKEKRLKWHLIFDIYEETEKDPQTMHGIVLSFPHDSQCLMVVLAFLYDQEYLAFK